MFPKVKNKLYSLLHNKKPVTPSPRNGATPLTSGSYACTCSPPPRTSPSLQIRRHIELPAIEQKKISAKRGAMSGPIVDRFSDELCCLYTKTSMYSHEILLLIDKYITSGAVHINAKLTGDINILYFIIGSGHPDVTRYLIELGV
ncbi:MAG: hypothetical protein C5B47_08125, partial [Verrucomicrobia bacterium]